MRIVTHDPVPAGMLYIAGVGRVEVGEPGGHHYARAEWVQEALEDFPGLDLDALFGPKSPRGEVKIHVLQNPRTERGERLGNNILIAQQDDEDPRARTHHTVGHEFGEMFVARYLRLPRPGGSGETFEDALQPYTPPNADCLPEDCRWLFGGPLVRAKPHKLRYSPATLAALEQARPIWEEAVANAMRLCGDSPAPEPAQAEIRLKVGSLTATVNGREVQLDAAPLLKGGRVLVPLRFVAEALGCGVLWDQGTKTVTIR